MCVVKLGERKRGTELCTRLDQLEQCVGKEPALDRRRCCFLRVGLIGLVERVENYRALNNKWMAERRWEL